MTIDVYTDETETSRIKWTVNILAEKTNFVLVCRSAIPQCLYEDRWCDLSEEYHYSKPTTLDYDAKGLVRAEIIRLAEFASERQ